MQTMRLVPFIFLAACSLEIEGTKAANPAVDSSADGGATALAEVDAARVDSPACTPSSDAAECMEVDLPDGGADNIQGACAAPEADGDGDGRPDCQDGCPSDPNKTSPQVCGCGIADRDRDHDNTPDCVDPCSSDAKKTTPGVCGCDMSDADSDGDGFADCVDACVGFSDDSNKQGCTCDPALQACGNRPPTVAIVEPSSDMVKTYGLTIRAEAHDEDGTIKRVTLFVDGKQVRDERQAPYVWGADGAYTNELQNLSAGTHMIEAEAEDDGGATARAHRELTIVE